MKQHLVSQANVLCEAGLARAAHSGRDSQYKGESWKPMLVDLLGKEVEVSILVLERTQQHTTVQVTAVISDPAKQDYNRIQRSLTTSLDFGSKVSD